LVIRPRGDDIAVGPRSQVKSGAERAGGGIRGGAGWNDRVLDVGAAGNVKIFGLAVMGGHPSGHGGGIYNSGRLELANSTLSGNEAADLGGGLYNYAANALTLHQVTVANDTARHGGGLALRAGTTTTLINSLVAGNFDPHGVNNDCAAGTVALIAVGKNLVQASNSCSLGPLAANGGPTLSHLPYANSPAVNAAAQAFCLPTDQHGVARPVGPACDIGSVEGGGAWPHAISLPLVRR
jgi:hypothetical protein